MNPFKPDHLPLDCINWESQVGNIGKANAALARYDGMLRTIVNPGLLLSPLITQEAVLSSRIEGTQASLAEVMGYEAEPAEPLGENKYNDIQEIINYRTAIGRACSFRNSLVNNTHILQKSKHTKCQCIPNNKHIKGKENSD